MAEIRLNKIIKQFRISLDSLVDFLEEKGVEVNRHPNAKISSDYMPALIRRFGSDPSFSEPPSDLQYYIKELRISQIKLIKLVEERRIGGTIKPYLDNNQRILHRLVELSHERPEFHDTIQKTIEAFSQRLTELNTAYRSSGKHKKAGVMKADFIVKIQKQYLKALDEMVLNDVLEIVEVDWDNVVFQNGKVLLDIGKGKRLVCTLSESREAYNLFRVAFVQRVPPLRVRIHSKKGPEIVETPEFKEVFNYLKIRNEIRLGSFSRRFELMEFLRTSRVNFQETLLPKDKGPYIQFLVEKQSSEYRFIPVYEQAIDHEDAFLFTLVGSRMFIVWENIHEDTATYIFPVTKKDYDTVIQAIFDYASSDTDYKRMRMHYGESTKIIGTDCRIIYHDNFPHWKMEIQAILGMGSDARI